MVWLRENVNCDTKRSICQPVVSPAATKAGGRLKSSERNSSKVHIQVDVRCWCITFSRHFYSVTIAWSQAGCTS